jgi:hypothetical protein
MQKIDRLGWAAGITFIAYGVRAGVRVNTPDVLDRLLGHLPPQWRPSPSPVVERLYSIIVGVDRTRPGVRLMNLVYANANRIARTAELQSAIDTFESDLQMCVAEAAPRRVFVHAGVVGWKGQAILLPGTSFSGKSTLVAELTKAGATYYSDEYAVLDMRGRVHPYARPLGIRQNGHLERATKLTVESLGGQSGVQPLPVGLILMTTYKRGATWRPRRLSAGEGALELLANTVAARRQPEQTLATLRRVVSRAPVLKGSRGEVHRVVDSILQTLECIANQEDTI